MDFVRKVINGNEIQEGIEIPDELKKIKLEVLIFPYKEERKAKKVKKSIAGALAKYANKNLIKQEDTAWLEAIEE